MDENLIEEIRSILKKLPFDLRAEVATACMRARGIKQDDIILSPLGLFRRKYNRDVDAISILETKSGKEYVQLKLNREGIYDAIPEAVSHTARRGNSRGIKDTSEMIEEVKLRRREEKAARLFFLPFENEYGQLLVNLEIEEQNILKGYVSNSRYSAMLNDFWQLPDVLDARQKATFIYLIPLIHKASGDLHLTKLCYEAILDTNVNFNITESSAQKAFNTYSLSDGKLRLGVNFVCGKNFNSHEVILQIIIGPLSEEQLPQYLKEGRGRAVVEFLNSYFLEASCTVKIIVKTEEKVHPDTLNGTRLGYARL